MIWYLVLPHKLFICLLIYYQSAHLDTNPLWKRGIQLLWRDFITKSRRDALFISVTPQAFSFPSPSSQRKHDPPVLTHHLNWATTSPTYPSLGSLSLQANKHHMVDRRLWNYNTAGSAADNRSYLDANNKNTLSNPVESIPSATHYSHYPRENDQIIKSIKIVYRTVVRLNNNSNRLQVVAGWIHLPVHPSNYLKHTPPTLWFAINRHGICPFISWRMQSVMCFVQSPQVDLLMSATLRDNAQMERIRVLLFR